MTLRATFQALRDYMNTRIIGQEALIQKMLVAMLCDGHLLVEGTPGLAKTKAIKVLASAIDAQEHRIQFTPDLLPSDITGSDVFRPENSSFYFQRGPLFHNFILADEINRAPAKVQSALLEAMGERQITVGNTTYQLPQLFTVMATQNPIEQEGTYALPEAKLDRFLMYVKIQYPDAAAERKILKLVQQEEKQIPFPPFPKIKEKQIFEARRQVLDVYMSPDLEEYIIQFVMATRNPGVYDKNLADMIAYGVSPRGTIAWDVCARAVAWLNGDKFVTPEHLRAVVYDVLRHRLIPSFEATSSGFSSEALLTLLLNKVPMP